MPHRSVRLPLSFAMAAFTAVALTPAGALASPSPDPIDLDQVNPTTVSFGGADALPTTRTVQHWSGETQNPADGVTYRYNMVGVDPSTDSSATIGVDIIPLVVNVDGFTFSASDWTDAVLASPLFREQGFAATTSFTSRIGTQLMVPGGVPLSAGGHGQLLDVTMQAGFNRIGTGYQLLLGDPAVYDPVTIDVNGNHGTTFVTPAFDQQHNQVRVAYLDQVWFQTRVQNLIGRLHLDPTRLAIFLTVDTLLYANHAPGSSFVVGGHGAGHVTGQGAGSVNGNGDQPVNTFVWSSWLRQGVFGPGAWINKDISGLSHEVTEWAMDPFLNNTVQPWLSANAPQYGCTDELESGDPTVNQGFAIGSNPFANDFFVWSAGRQAWMRFHDPTWHVQDEVFIPWFMRIAPADNDMTQPRQFSALGRYTLMGDLNRVPEFSGPAASC